MKFSDRIYYFINKDTKSLFYKQPDNTLMCFPVALYNLHIFKRIKPPKLKKLMKWCNCSEDNGTLLRDIPTKLISDLGLTITKHTNVVLKYGGIMIMKTYADNISEDLHAVLCYPTNKRINNKRLYTFINFGDGKNKIIDLTYDQFEGYIIKGKKNIVKGYCLN